MRCRHGERHKSDILKKVCTQVEKWSTVTKSKTGGPKSPRNVGRPRTERHQSDSDNP